MKKIALAIIITLMGLSCFSADQLNWYNTLIIVDSGGSAVLESNSWLVRMYKDGGNGTIDFASGLPGGDDTWLNLEANFGGLGVDGYFNAIFQTGSFGSLLPNDDVYSVVFNASSYGAATAFAVIDNGLFSMPSSFDPPKNYDTGGVLAGDWQAVPEPATALLFGIGGLGAFIVRRNKQKAQEEADA